MAKTNLNGIFLSFRVKLTLKTCSYLKKQFTFNQNKKNFLSPTFENFIKLVWGRGGANKLKWVKKMINSVIDHFYDQRWDSNCGYGWVGTLDLKMDLKKKHIRVIRGSYRKILYLYKNMYNLRLLAFGGQGGMERSPLQDVCLKR